jgi:hypothetical protein
VLLGVGRTPEARLELRRSLGESGDPASVAKSLAVLLLSHLPRVLQPVWPPPDRHWASSDEN